MRNIGITFKATLIFYLLHIPLGLILKNYNFFVVFYGFFILLLGCLSVLTSKRDDLFYLLIVSYLVGAEVLFRMCEKYEATFRLFWEFGKYSVSAILLLAMFIKREKKKTPTEPLNLYFLLLLPGIFFTNFESFEQFRKDISFNMSGPFSLFICGLYFSRLKLTKQDLKKIFSWLLAPLVSISFIALKTLKEASEIRWTTSSSFIASGGFGPNQVSSILGFGMLLCVLLFLLLEKNKIFKVMFLVFLFWFFSQALLTFSRGGVVNAVIPFFIFLLFLIRERRKRFTVLFSGIFIILLSYYYIIPKVNEFTSGTLLARYSEKEKIGEIEILDTTGRSKIIEADIQVFMDNFLFGVGVGNSKRYYKEILGRASAAHTEWSRLLAEHGIFGLLSIFFLILWIFKRYVSKKDYISKALTASFAAFFIIYLFHSAMRLVLPSFVLGLLGAEFNFEEENS